LRLKASAAVVFLPKVIFWADIPNYLEILKVGHISCPETLVSDRKMTPGKNSKMFIQQQCELPVHVGILVDKVTLG
jgi:hypothetical protein